MRRFVLFVFVMISIPVSSYGQEIIPFPDLSDHHDYRKNGGRSIDERNYSMFSEDYQSALKKVDQEMDEFTRKRNDETEQEIIDELNKQLEELRKKRLSLLNEAELVEDLQTFY